MAFAARFEHHEAIGQVAAQSERGTRAGGSRSEALCLKGRRH